MKAWRVLLVAFCGWWSVGLASAQITFYEREQFGGRSFTTRDSVESFMRLGFNDRASSVVVQDGRWEVCDDVGFQGRCVILRPGHYRSLRDIDMNNRISSVRELRGRGHGHDHDHGRGDDDDDRPRPLPPQIVLYEHSGFWGQAFSSDHDVSNFVRLGFNDRASSAIVLGDRWEVCEHIEYGGRCVILRPGRYPDLRSMGLNDRLSSVRVLPVEVGDDDRYAPPPPPAYDWRRRPRERLHEVDVLSVRAVFAAPQQRCWVEREQVLQQGPRDAPNVGGAVVGGIIGGIIGHQAGGGDRDLATLGGAVAGAAIGAQVGRAGGRTVTTQDVRRCETLPPQERPEYWDVTYRFRGVEHHVQMTAPPGPTVTVNDDGEPRL